MTLSKVIWAQEGIPIHITKLLPDHKCGLNWPKQHPAKITPKRARSALSGDATPVTLVTNHSIFNQMTLSKVIRAQQWVPTQQSGAATTTMTWFGKKHAQPKSLPKQQIPLCQGIR